MSSELTRMVSRRHALKLLGLGASAGLLAATVAPAAASPLVEAVVPTGVRSAGPSVVVRQGVSLPAPEKKSLTLVHSTLETSQLAYAAAQQLGFFKKYGFEEVNLLFAEGDGKTLQALVSGNADMSAHGISVTISGRKSVV